MVIQTMLQISPPQLFDPAKEQVSACALSIPTPSMSAMFTAMKNLNYISANLTTFCTDDGPDTTFPPSDTCNDFDIGEMLQNVGDALSGAAAQVGVELVLFHGDVALKHIYVRGDESGTSYLLAHVSQSSPYWFLNKLVDTFKGRPSNPRDSSTG
jgi:osomolarity two-component system response regulator SSK1